MAVYSRHTSTFLQPKPPSRWCNVTTTLADFAIVTYAVPSDALHKLLPPEFEPDIFQLDNGSHCSFVSAVPFRDLDFRFECLPWIRFAFGQTNYRAYVKYKGKRCVWFFGTSLGSIWVNIPRHLWKLPWHPARIRLDAKWNDNCCQIYNLSTTGSWGAAQLTLTGTAEQCGRLDGFADIEETTGVLTHPLDGYYFRSDGRIGTYSIWHDRLNMQLANASQARFTVFEQLGLITTDQKPHSVLIQQTTEFIIVLPPQPLA